MFLEFVDCRVQLNDIFQFLGFFECETLKILNDKACSAVFLQLQSFSFVIV